MLLLHLIQLSKYHLTFFCNFWIYFYSNITDNIRTNIFIHLSGIFLLLRNDSLQQNGIILYNQQRYFQMLERFTRSFIQLKNSTSLKFIDATLREKSDQILERTLRLTLTIQLKPNKIEQAHQQLLHSISSFIDTFPHYAAELQQSFQSLQHQLVSTNKLYEEQKKDWYAISQDMNDKLQRVNKQMIAKDEQIRWLTLKLEERQTIIENLERQSNQYLKKVESQMYRQQKALEESCFIVSKLQQQIQFLKIQNENLQSRELQYDNNSEKCLQPIRNITSFAQLQINQSVQSSPSSNSLVRCSLGSNYSQDGLSQFQLVQQEERYVLDSIDGNGQLPVKCETIKQMLNMSVQKEYKIQYHLESVQNKNSKQNYKYYEIRDDMCKQNVQDGWGVNNSLELVGKDMKRIPIKQFYIASREDNKVNNPYYFYFLIASQNAKINSDHFQQICTLSTQSQWQQLNQCKTPLHEWQAHLRAYLLKEANIST